MCLITTKVETKEFKEQNKNKEFIICYMGRMEKMEYNCKSKMLYERFCSLQ